MATAKDPYRFFKVEVKELLEQLNQGMLALEKNPKDKDLLDQLFRHAHTLKGSARLVKLLNIGNLAHRIEDILGGAKSGELALSSAHIDIFLKGLDAIGGIVKLLDDGKDPHIDVEPFLKNMVFEPLKKQDLSPSSQTATLPATHSEPVSPSMPLEVKTAPAPEALFDTSPEAAPEGPIKDKETIRVSIQKLDTMFALSGELMINKIKLQDKLLRLNSLKRLIETNAELIEGWAGLTENQDFTSLKPQADLVKEILSKIDRFIQLQHKIKDEFLHFILQYDEDVKLTHLISMGLQEAAFNARLLPASTILSEVNRLVRDLSKELDKNVTLHITGGNIDVDKHILDEMKAPLFHLIRNAIDHGIESPEERVKSGKDKTGNIRLTLEPQGSTLAIVCEDDGRGVDIERIRSVAVEKKFLTKQKALDMSPKELLYLILEPGFSTAEILTNLSGRGVGLDVAANAVAKLRGNIVIHTEKGQFTRFSIQIPKSLASLTCLVLVCGFEKLLLPLDSVVATYRIGKDEIEMETNREVIQVFGKAVPLVQLNELLQLPAQPPYSEKLPVVVVSSRDESIAFVVHRLLGVQDVVVKNLGNHISKIPNIGGATIMGDGNPVIILDPVELVRNVSEVGRKSVFEQEYALETQAEELPILVIDDSLTTRMLEKSILESAGYMVDLAVSGEEALEKTKQNKYSLLIVDVEMPGINGFELLSRLNAIAEYANVPSIIVSSLATPEMKRKGIEAGAKAYIVKGQFDQNYLLETIRSLI